MLGCMDAAAPPSPLTAPAARLPRRFRSRLLAVLLVAGLAPLGLWWSVGRSFLGGALAVAPPVGELVGQAADRLERLGDRSPLVGELRAAELHMAQADLARRSLLARAPVYFLGALALSTVLVTLAALLLGRRLSRPVEVLAAAMSRYARGELGHQVPLTGRGDELDFLAVELNRMGRELAAQRERLRVSEGLAAWRDAARALAHDLKNPLTAMRMALARLTRRVGPSDQPPAEAAVAESVSLLQEEMDVLIRMSQSFAEFARLPDAQRQPLDLAGVIEDLAGLYRAECPGGALEVQIRARPVVLGDADQIRRAVGNLVKNAIEASRAAGAAGPIRLSLGVGVGVGDGTAARIEVRDRGVGIAAPVEGQALMDGLRSSKAAGQRGLGLPIAHKIIHEHGGRLRLTPGDGAGTTAAVELPLLAEQAS
jgi:two-component system, NtrC family, nitrogen regulation sensor histidine kinase NtrY